MVGDFIFLTCVTSTWLKTKNCVHDVTNCCVAFLQRLNAMQIGFWRQVRNSPFRSPDRWWQDFVNFAADKKAIFGWNRLKTSQYVWDRCKDLFKRKKYLRVRCMQFKKTVNFLTNFILSAFIRTVWKSRWAQKTQNVAAKIVSRMAAWFLTWGSGGQSTLFVMKFDRLCVRLTH